MGAIRHEQISVAFWKSISSLKSHYDLHFPVGGLVNDVAKALGSPVNDHLKSCVFSYWSEQLRNGAIGQIIPDGQSQPRYFVTEAGEATLQHVSRDPLNQNGYLKYLDSEVAIDPVARSYAEEAIKAYSASCYKAAAVMIGAAAECLILCLRDQLASSLKNQHANVPAKLDDRSIKNVVEAIYDKIKSDLNTDAKRTKNPETKFLSEEVESRLLPVALELRKTRNNAGHPASLSSINPADVHCGLLLFPSVAKMLTKLTAWVANFYV